MLAPLILRADATAHMGTGHILRMMALGQAWQHRGGSVHFVTATPIVPLLERLQSEGFHLHRLPEAWPENRADLHSMTTLAHELNARWVVTDGYHFDLAYQQQIRAQQLKLLYVDDYAHLAEYDADILLNMNIDSEELAYVTPRETIRLLGPNYALLRKEFWQTTVPATRSLNHILVTMGGGDPGNLTGRILQGFKGVNAPGLEVTALLGAANPHRQAIEELVATLPLGKVNVLQNTLDMPALLRTTDLAIAAGGGTCWELMYFGIPALLVCLAENQERIVKGLSKRGAASDLGWHADLTPEKVAAQLRPLLTDAKYLLSMRQKTSGICDGRGAHKAVAAMEPDVDKNLGCATLNPDPPKA